MTDPIRFFADDAAVRRVGEGLLDRSLPREEWTHEAHLASCLWLLRERPDIVPERDLPAIIRGFNEAKGGVNDDTQGYHETITQLYVRAVRGFAAWGKGGLCERVNALLASPIGAREWPLGFYSRARLFSVEARRGWVEPDLQALADAM
ncbi:MAG TPA: hypothetical protein VM055_05250 [Novosphingobium sp.]|nr:hypothetical protein [Novosphingobium sp.]